MGYYSGTRTPPRVRPPKRKKERESRFPPSFLLLTQQLAIPAAAIIVLLGRGKRRYWPCGTRVRPTRFLTERRPF